MYLYNHRDVSEWFKVQSWNDCAGATPPRVRIPSSLNFVKLDDVKFFIEKNKKTI